MNEQHTHLTSDMINLADLRSSFSETRNDPTYMASYLKGFMNHLEHTVPGVREEIQKQITRLKLQKFCTE